MENEQKNRRARCSGAPCEYTFFLQNIAQRFKQMDSEEKNGGLIASGRLYEYARVRYLAQGWKRMENEKKSAGSLQRSAL